jgi:hypothetical protein
MIKSVGRSGLQSPKGRTTESLLQKCWWAKRNRGYVAWKRAQSRRSGHQRMLKSAKEIKVCLSVGKSRRNKFNFIHFWSVTLVNTIKTTWLTPPSVIKLHLLFAHAFTCFGFLVNHLHKANQLSKETTITWYTFTSNRSSIQVKVWHLRQQ